MCAYIVVAVLSGLAGGFDAKADDARKPDALLAAERARMSINTARIELSISDTATGGARASRTRFFEWRRAGNDVLSVFHGDTEGVVLRGPDQKPAEYTYNGPIHALAKGADLWTHTQDALFANVWNTDQRERFQAYDLRRAGLNPSYSDRTLEEVAATHGYPPLSYSTSTDGDLVVVIGRTAECEFRWWIDPQRGHSITRTETRESGKVIGREEIKVQQFDGVWFPVRMERFRLAAGDVQPSRVVEVLSAEFNRPDHPKQFTPADIGIEAGNEIIPMMRDGGGMWDGHSVVSLDEYDRRVADGSLVPGPTVSRELERIRERAKMRRESQATSTNESTTPASAHDGDSSEVVSAPWDSAWEIYTRQFISRYRLDDDQTKRAVRVLRDCQSDGHAYLRRRKTEFAELDALGDPVRAADASRTAKTDRLAERKQRLLAPIDQIFEERLKPGLERLPTPAQRAAGESDASSPRIQKKGT